MGLAAVLLTGAMLAVALTGWEQAAIEREQAAMEDRYGPMPGGGSSQLDADTPAARMLVPWQYAVGAFAASSAALMALLFSRLKTEEVLYGVRKRIYDFVSKNPGGHLAGITRALDIPSSSARYHLWVLEYNEKLIAYRMGKRKHYYLSHNGYGIYTNGFEYKDILSTLRNATARKIVRFLLDHEGASQKSVAEFLGMHPSTVNWHARRLTSAHMVLHRREGKEVSYSLNKEVEFGKLLALIEGGTF